MKYPKINTLFKRDTDNIIMLDSFTDDTFSYLENNLWECTEKIDGTNIRIELEPTHKGTLMSFKGRTEDAIIPKHLLLKLNQLFLREDLIRIFDLGKATDPPITIFGEGYGVKIQKGGNYIKNDVNFILFDIKIGNYWLSRVDLESLALELNINIVPFVGYFTLPDAINYVKKGFKSNIAENTEYDAEGLVLKSTIGLLDRGGNRIITKLKTSDFIKYNLKHNKV